MSIVPFCKNIIISWSMSTPIWNDLFSGLDLCAEAHIGIATAWGMSIAGIIERILIIGSSLAELSIKLF